MEERVGKEEQVSQLGRTRERERFVSKPAKFFGTRLPVQAAITKCHKLGLHQPQHFSFLVLEAGKSQAKMRPEIMGAKLTGEVGVAC